MGLCTPPSAVLPAGRGIRVRNGLVADGTSVTLMDPTQSPTQGAAYVLISHGQNGAGGYISNSGQLITMAVYPVGVAGNREAQNGNDQVMAGWYAIDADYNEARDSVAHFDDLVLRPSIMKVILQAQRGPRAH